ncbi:hypothetical protein BH09BAC1_BH09BAC1_08320 [soil metagenome]
MKTNSFSKTLFFALMISATSMFVSCAGGEGDNVEVSVTDTTAVVTPVEPVAEPVTTTTDSTYVVDSTATTPH